MIDFKNNIFYLGTAQWSCILRVTKMGLLEQVHFGLPVSIDDAEVLACKPSNFWGASILLDEADPASSPDVLPLAWSSSGRGDYRETPCAFEMNGQAMAADFCYVSHRMHKGCVPMDSLPQARDCLETLEIVMADGDLHLHLYFSVFRQALTRRCVLENTGENAVTIRKLMSFCMDIPGRFNLTTLNGGWISETHRHCVPVGETRYVNESTTGASSNRHNPGFLLSDMDATEETGRVYGFNLIYSGNHYAGIQRSHQGLNRILQGISPDHFAWILNRNERFETPEAVLAFSSEGFNGLSRCMHDFVNRHIIPKAWQFKERPVLYNSWEGCGFDFDEARLLSLAGQAKALGCELFVLDDGWFGKRCSDTAGLGDYNVNLERLPSGLKGLSDKLRSLGLDFGLWFEPESVNPNSDLYRSHPDWIQQDRLPPLLGRHQLLLDLGKPEVRDYIVENVSTILDEADVRYVKWDMNRYSTLLGARTHLHILGLHDVLRRIFGPRPNILLETCSSGGNRFDLGMLCFSPQIWASDNTDPIERIDIQEGLSLLYPQSAIGAHVSAAPHCQTMRITPLSTRAHVSFFGILGYEFDLNELTDTQRDEIRKQIGFYKENRRLFQFGSFHRMKTEYGTGWQVSLEDQHIVGLFHRLIPASPGYESISLQGLDLHKKYRAAFALREETNSILCSGAALKAGWILPPLFCGTGNLAESRNHADFGSDLLKIEGL